jgi:hypothetical protein
MKWLEALLRSDPTTVPARVMISLPDDGPDAPLDLVNPHGFGRHWRRVTDADERPAVYALIG